MDDAQLFLLQLRLKNCLQTILDLEPDLERMELGEMLMREFHLLKAFMERVADVRLHEADVDRIEQATACFLDELREPLTEHQEYEQRPLPLH